jgi:glycosyltransferase involved in cell wall biosynthesis
VRVLIDYRSALRSRSGAGEYVHQLAAALVAVFPPDGRGPQLDLTLFSSSWKDRLQLTPDLDGVRAVDTHVPVSVLNLMWHRLEWPSAEALTRRSYDVTHSDHPLLLPARAAARVITIHDLNFLSHPERTRGEVRRDYAALIRGHANRADAILVPSRYTAIEVERQLGVNPDRIKVCPAGAPNWTARPPAASADSQQSTVDSQRYILFLGTLEPRKNIGSLLDAYERLLSSAAGARFPDLLLAGRATADSTPWLDRIARPPLAGHVRHAGYVDPADRRALYDGACMLVVPSFDEGFGIPALEAMTAGVPVVAADRGALPEVVGDAGLLVDAASPVELAAAMERMLKDEALASASVVKGVQRARQFSWKDTAKRVYELYTHAIEQRKRPGR